MLRRDWLKGLCAAVGGMVATKTVAAAPVVATEPVVAAAEPVAVDLTTSNYLKQSAAAAKEPLFVWDSLTGVERIHDSVIVEGEMDFKALEEYVLRSQGIDGKLFDGPLSSAPQHEMYERELLARMHGPIPKYHQPKETSRWSSDRPSVTSVPKARTADSLSPEFVRYYGKRVAEVAEVDFPLDDVNCIGYWARVAGCHCELPFVLRDTPEYKAGWLEACDELDAEAAAARAEVTKGLPYDPAKPATTQQLKDMGLLADVKLQFWPVHLPNGLSGGSIG